MKIEEKIKWIGHASFVIESSEQRIYIDPFRLNGEYPHADIILITHPHQDHLSIEDINKIADGDTRIYLPMDSVGKIEKGRAKGVKPGEEHKDSGFIFKTVPAYNKVEARLHAHPRKNGWVGYIAHIGGKSLYHAGDTDLIDEMSGIKADMSLLPMGGTYTMNVEEAIEAAGKITSEIYAPMHYKALLGMEESKKAERLFLEKVKKGVILDEIQEAQYSF